MQNADAHVWLYASLLTHAAGFGDYTSAQRSTIVSKAAKAWEGLTTPEDPRYYGCPCELCVSTFWLCDEVPW